VCLFLLISLLSTLKSVTTIYRYMDLFRVMTPENYEATSNPFLKY
jgi:hypothetical protein